MTLLKKSVFYLSVLGFFLIPLFFSRQVLATQFDLIAPQGQLTRGQEYQFVININTEGQPVTDAQIGMTYETQYLEYVTTVPGDAFTSVSVAPQAGGKIVFSASDPAGYNGQGTFATVTFKLIATAPGSSQLCVLWAPSPTSSPAGPTATPSALPTALPKTGEVAKVNEIMILGGVFILLAGGLFIVNRNSGSTIHKPHKKLH